MVVNRCGLFSAIKNLTTEGTEEHGDLGRNAEILRFAQDDIGGLLAGSY
jgi:hypothetical protein